MNDNDNDNDNGVYRPVNDQVAWARAYSATYRDRLRLSQDRQARCRVLQLEICRRIVIADQNGGVTDELLFEDHDHLTWRIADLENEQAVLIENIRQLERLMWPIPTEAVVYVAFGDDDEEEE